MQLRLCRGRSPGGEEIPLLFADDKDEIRSLLSSSHDMIMSPVFLLRRMHSSKLTANVNDKMYSMYNSFTLSIFNNLLFSHMHLYFS